MAATLRELLVQRAARLQERPALTTSTWGTLSWAGWRNRVEGIALGLLAAPLGSALYSTGHGPWDWAAEVAVACCGLTWKEGGDAIPDAILGGPSFNSEAGRGPYHDQEQAVLPSTPFTSGLTQGELLTRLQHWNRQLGWDHSTTVALSPEQTVTNAGRAALWCALYAGAHVRMVAPTPRAIGLRRWLAPAPAAALDLAPFSPFWPGASGFRANPTGAAD